MIIKLSKDDTRLYLVAWILTSLTIISRATCVTLVVVMFLLYDIKLQYDHRDCNVRKNYHDVTAAFSALSTTTTLVEGVSREINGRQSRY